MESTEIRTSQAARYTGSHVKLSGHVHALRHLGNLSFIVLRDRSGTIQIVVEDANLLQLVATLSPETAISVSGHLVENPRLPGSVELSLSKLELLCTPTAPLPVEIYKDKKMETLTLASMLDYRPLTLRAEKVRSIFKIEAVLCSAFREFLNAESFVEIHSPKIVSTGTEGGAQLFNVDYFGRTAYLAQSPQFYKQIMVGVFERVYEIGPVYRAEQHDTSRHLNEYVSMDFEMGFIKNEQDVISMQIKLLKHMFQRLKEVCSAELAAHNSIVPEIANIPQITLQEAAQLLTSRLGWKPVSTAGEPITLEAVEDLDPEGERLLCQYFGQTQRSELVYVTQYPLAVRPFYAMPLEGTPLSRSFDLLFRGSEITTGGQRIHECPQLIASIEGSGLAAESFADYLQCFRYGMPPHGGLAIGLERLTKQLLGLPNIKLASLFPRDRNRISP